MNTNLDQRHDAIAGAVLATLAGLGTAGALLNATGHPVLVDSALIVLVLIVSAARSVARRVRERQEDAADTLAGAIWRARHVPGHPLDAHRGAGVL